MFILKIIITGEARVSDLFCRVFRFQSVCVCVCVCVCVYPHNFTTHNKSPSVRCMHMVY